MKTKHKVLAFIFCSLIGISCKKNTKKTEESKPVFPNPYEYAQWATKFIDRQEQLFDGVWILDTMVWYNRYNNPDIMRPEIQKHIDCAVDRVRQGTIAKQRYFEYGPNGKGWFGAAIGERNPLTWEYIHVNYYGRPDIFILQMSSFTNGIGRPISYSEAQGVGKPNTGEYTSNRLYTSYDVEVIGLMGCDLSYIFTDGQFGRRFQVITNYKKVKLP